MIDKALCKGSIQITIDYADGTSKSFWRNNTILQTGKAALASTLAGDIGSLFSFYICQMQFGTAGTDNGTPRFVDSSRTGLFSPVLIAKNVTSTIDPSNPTEVIFTAILAFGDAVGSTINEMALQLANGNLYSMVTFGDIAKTAQMQITYSWHVAFI